MCLSSCYTCTTVVGSGAKGYDEIREWNHYLLGGLVAVEVSDPKNLAGGAADYDVTVVHTFINGLVTGLSFGIYAPTTTVVTK